MARTFAALLVDLDLKGLEALVYGFQGADWRITACPAPETAAFLVKASAADVVVVASREPHDRTLNLVRQFRSQEDTRTLPVLVLGPASVRASVLESGNVDFLSTPVFVRDAIMASRISIATPREPEPKIDGSLSDLSLLSLLRSMSGLGRSGVMHVERAGRRGEVLFSEGELTGSQLGALHGSAALHHLLLWEDGRISLSLRAVGRRSPVNQRFDQIIEEAERFLRDYSHAISGLGGSSTVYEKNEARLSGSALSLPSEIMPIVRLCDGQRTLADMIDQSPFRVFDTIRIVARLVDLGAISQRRPAEGISRSTEDLRKFWATARIDSPDDQPSAPPVARSGAMDARVGEPNRRKLQRRARAETPVLGTPLAELVDAKPPASQSAAATQPAPIEAQQGKARTSGVLQVPAGERRQTKHDRRERPSVTIDVGLVEAVVQKLTPPPIVQEAATPTSSEFALTPAMGRPVMRSGMKPARTPAVGRREETPASNQAVTPAPTAAPASGAPIVAEISAPRTEQVPLASASPPEPMTPVVTSPPAPSDQRAHAEAPRGARATGTLSIPQQRTSVPKAPPSPGVSVQLDPVLVAELDRLEKATVPAEPASSSDAPTAPLKASGGTRITGTLSVSSTPRSSNKHRPPSGPGISVALDPSLAEEAQKAASEPAEGNPDKAPAVSDAVAPAKRPSQPMAVEAESGRAGAHISGAFNAVESDFFAREADLYKGDGDDNFADLDEPSGRSGSKTSSRRQNRR